MDNLHIAVIIATVPILVLAFFADRRRWTRKPQEELIRGINGEDWRHWKPSLRELRRRGEDIRPFVPRLLRSLVADSHVTRVAGKLVLKDLYPDIRPHLKDFQGTDDLPTCRAKAAPLLNQFGVKDL